MLSVFALALLVGCGDGTIDTVDVNKDGIVEEIDEDPPIIVHTPVEGTQTFGADVAIEAIVTDPGGAVVIVQLSYKISTDGAGDWQKQRLITTGNDVYTGTIPGEDHSGSGVNYYIEAIDRSQNSGFSPEDGKDDPYHFRVAE